MRRQLRGIHVRSGAAAVELAMVLPFLLLLLVGAWEVGRMVEVSQALNNAAREGARFATYGNKTYADVQSTVQTCLTRAGITNQTGLKVGIKNLTLGQPTGNPDPPQYDPSQATQMNELEITVSLPYSSVLWSPLQSITGVSTLSASAHWYSARDTAVEIGDIPP